MSTTRITLADVNRLVKSELSYELKIRGIEDGENVDSQRRTLRTLLKLEKTNDSLACPAHPFTFEVDSQAVGVTISEIEGLLATFDGIANSNEHGKILAKIHHALGRIDRSVPSEVTEKSLKSKLMVKLLAAISDIERKIRKATRISRSSVAALDLSLLQSQSESSDDSSDEEDNVVRSGPSTSTPERRVVQESKSVPIYKWNLKFTGMASGLSLNAFLTQVEELRIARGATKEQLFQSALDLFSGKALLWYRAVRKTLRDWNALVEALKEEFQTPDYDEKMFLEIKRRTQGNNESIGMYLAVMSNMFECLSVRIPEKSQLKIVLGNILPYYQNQLALKEIDNLSQLKQLCRQLELRRASAEAYVPPPPRSKTLEPELAYVEASAPSASCLTVSDPVRCWNCNKTNHRSRECREPRQKHCYRCGYHNVTIKDCPRCSKPDQGNGRQRR